MKALLYMSIGKFAEVKIILFSFFEFSVFSKFDLTCRNFSRIASWTNAICCFLFLFWIFSHTLVSFVHNGLRYFMYYMSDNFFPWQLLRMYQIDFIFIFIILFRYMAFQSFYSLHVLSPQKPLNIFNNRIFFSPFAYIAQNCIVRALYFHSENISFKNI